jgi:hypothetical protein
MINNSALKKYPPRRAGLSGLLDDLVKSEDNRIKQNEKLYYRDFYGVNCLRTCSNQLGMAAPSAAGKFYI